MKLLDLVFDLSAYFFRRGREINTGGKDVTAKSYYLQEVSEPGTPDSGYGVIYAKTDGKLYFKNDAGTETAIT